MKRSRGRRAFGVLAFGAAAVLAGVAGPAADADPVARQQSFDVTIDYTCAFPAAGHPTAVHVTATAPTAAEVGDPVAVTDAVVELTLPPEAAAELTAAGASVVGAITDLAATAGDVVAPWSGSAPDTPVPADANLVLSASVGVPEARGAEPGELVFTAGPLALTLLPRLADGTAAETVPVNCAPTDPDQLRLGAVRIVAPGTGAPSRAPLPGDPSAGGSADGPANGLTVKGTPPPDCKVIPPPQPPKPGVAYCAYLTGFANVAKLDAATLQPPGIVNIAAENPVLNCKNDGGRKWACQRATVEPNLNGQPQLPPATSSFLAFGVMPTRATMQLTQIGQTDVTLEFTYVGMPRLGVSVAKGKMMARIFDASVNGVPLELGANCQTETPIDVTLTATAASYSITLGGVLDGTITIPPFSGCGVTEDLDPIITGMVSGAGNYVKMTQGPICTILGQQTGCPPVVPEPQR
jgi:uncharacterized protein DUF6801